MTVPSRPIRNERAAAVNMHLQAEEEYQQRRRLADSPGTKGQQPRHSIDLLQRKEETKKCQQAFPGATVDMHLQQGQEHHHQRRCLADLLWIEEETQKYPLADLPGVVVKMHLQQRQEYAQQRQCLADLLWMEEETEKHSLALSRGGKTRRDLVVGTSAIRSMAASSESGLGATPGDTWVATNISLSAIFYLFDFGTTLNTLHSYYQYNEACGRNINPACNAFGACVILLVAAHVSNCIIFWFMLDPADHPLRLAYFLPLIHLYRLLKVFRQTCSCAG